MFRELPRVDRIRAWSRVDLTSTTVITASPTGVLIVERAVGEHEARLEVRAIDQVRELLQVVPPAEREVLVRAWSHHVDMKTVDLLIASVLVLCATAGGAR